MPNKIPEGVALQAKYELARRFFWDYCKLKAPEFYLDNRSFLKNMCYKLQNFLESDNKIMVVNMPPRHGKSFTATLFTQWIFGQYPKTRVMTGSYNETLSSGFAKQVRDSIMEDDGKFRKVFPETRIKKGEAVISKWALEGSDQTSYLATSMTGTATGMGAEVLIIDDIIKNAEEAYNERHLDKVISWFNNTMLSRLENEFKIILIMTRWASMDLAGYVLEEYKDVEHIIYKAKQDDGTMLCSDILNEEDFNFKTMNMNKDIIEANYNQNPIDIVGRLYGEFLTYDTVPTAKYIMNCTDTADEGGDYLCSIDYIQGFDNRKYVIDILFTKDPMEITEPLLANMLLKDNVGYCKIESNNGGRGFARNVTRESKELGNRHTKVDWFHQTHNKNSRILTNATGVMQNVVMPKNWKTLFPEFYTNIVRYQKDGKNTHDDAADTITMTYETNAPNTMQFGNKKIF